jgi:hypothetical protein
MGGGIAILLLIAAAPANALRAVAPVGRVSVKTTRIPALSAPSLSLGDALISEGHLPSLESSLPDAVSLTLPENATPLQAPRFALEAADAGKSPESMPAAAAFAVEPIEKTPFARRIAGAVKDWGRTENADGSARDFSDKLAERFDGRELSRYMRDEWATPVPAEAAERYRSAREASRWSVEGDKETELVDAAAGVAEAMGISVERRTYEIAGRVFEGFHVLPAARGSRLNRLAARLKSRLGAEMDYIPGRTDGASAMFNGEEGRLYLPAFGDVDSYAAILHETRHAFYKALLARGEMRLFHLSLLGAGRHNVAPTAWTYTKYLSLEELSTYPKTLRHLATLAKKRAASQERRAVVSTLVSRVLQYDDILNSSVYSMEMSQRRRAAGKFEAHELDSNALRAKQLGVPPNGSQWAVRLPHAWAYSPVETAPELPWWKRPFVRKDAHAVSTFDLRAELVLRLAKTVRPTLSAFKKELEKPQPDIDALLALSNRLVAATDRADADFVARYADLSAGR